LLATFYEPIQIFHVLAARELAEVSSASSHLPATTA
jgi:hypothetical protein